MGNTKSRPNDSRCEAQVLELFCDLYQDVADSLSLSCKESSRDLVAIRRRVAHEGVRFLTYTLNTHIGKEIEKSLQSGYAAFPFLRKRKGQSTPRFLGGLLSMIYDEVDQTPECPGGLRLKALSPAVVKVVGGLRQLFHFAWKTEIPYTEEVAAQVVAEFVSVDNSLPDVPREGPDERIVAYARSFVTEMFMGVHTLRDDSGLQRFTDQGGRFCPKDIIPRHGPGAVSTGEAAEEKHLFQRLYTKLNSVYPFDEYFVYSVGAVCDSYPKWQSLRVYEEGAAKVVLVPKDSRGPRLISCEPLEYQWIQQGLGRKFRDFVEKHPFTRGHVNFTDQSINRGLALLASRTQSHVTLDMKEASDRVSLALVSELFRDCPELLQALLACRTRFTRLPNGNLHKMKKFAPMGSNLCFPVEALVFYVLGVSAMVLKHGLSRREARKAMFVYGDDLIVDTKYHGALLDFFPSVGLKFNSGKSFTTGSFRESCGCDALDGVDITPLRLRRVWGRQRKDPAAAASYVALGNACAKRGYWRTANRLISTVTRKIGPLPLLHESREGKTAGLCWYEYASHVYMEENHVVRRRWNAALQRGEYATWRSDPEEAIGVSDDWSIVLRRFTTPSEHDDPEVFTLPRRNRLKRGWTH